MSIIKRDIKKVFAELEAIEHEIILIDYSFSNDEFIICAWIIHLNSMNLHFMFNDSQIKNNIFMTEQKEIENFASNIAADNDKLINFMNIAAIINEKDFINIATSINEEDFMNISRFINEKDIIVVTQNSINNIVIIIDAEWLRRETLLKKIIDSKDNKDSNFMKNSNSSKSKKLTFKNLSAKFKKSLKNQTLNKLRSSQKEENKEIIINEKNYHVECTIKYLHSCVKFIVKNLSTNLFILKSSRKSTKFAVNKKLTRIFCEITKNFVLNKIWRKNHHKIVIENFAFFLLLNKKSLRDLTQKISFITQRDVLYHYTNIFESRITQEKIWFTKELDISEKRFQRAQHATRTHWTWKIQAQTEDE